MCPLGKVVASEVLKGRIFEISLAELTGNEEDAFRKIKLRCEDVQGNQCLTNFHGMSMTTDKLHSLIRKWQSLIEANVDIKTDDGYYLRLFCIGFTKKRPNQARKTCYAKAAQIRQIRKKMIDIIKKQAADCDLKELVKKLGVESMGKEIEKVCRGIYPLQNVYIRKCKVLKTPRPDISKLLELYTETAPEEIGKKVASPAPTAPATTAPPTTKAEEKPAATTPVATTQ